MRLGKIVALELCYLSEIRREIKIFYLYLCFFLTYLFKGYNIKDRLIKDRQRERLHLDSGLDSDEEFERQLQLQIRKIGDYTASELARWKKYYKDTGVMKGPKEMWDNPTHKQEFINFLQEDGVFQDCL